MLAYNSQYGYYMSYRGGFYNSCYGIGNNRTGLIFGMKRIA